MSQKTEYRIINLRTYIGDKYLQFKSKKKVRCFPKFWKKKEELCWRFIPQENTYIIEYIDENDCPTYLPSGREHRYLHCFHNHEDYSIGGLTPFIKKFPNINDYFTELRQKRDNYLAEEEVRNSAPDIYTTSE